MVAEASLLCNEPRVRATTSGPWVRRVCKASQTPPYHEFQGSASFEKGETAASEGQPQCFHATTWHFHERSTQTLAGCEVAEAGYRCQVVGAHLPILRLPPEERQTREAGPGHCGKIQ